MTLTTLDSFIRGVDYADMMGRFCRWAGEAEYTSRNNLFDISAATRAVLMRSRFLGEAPTLCGGTEEYDSGNGSLMWILPAVLYCRFTLQTDVPSDAAFKIIHNVSPLTHGQPQAQVACGIYACAVFVGRWGKALCFVGCRAGLPDLRRSVRLQAGTAAFFPAIRTWVCLASGVGNPQYGLCCGYA